MDPTVHVELPSWLVEAAAACLPLPSQEARMAFAIGLARRNVETGSGGPFGAAVFESASGRLLAGSGIPGRTTNSP